MNYEDNEDTQASKAKILCVGCPLLDITYHCDSEILNQYNLKHDDCIKAQERHDSLFQKLFLNSVSRLIAGGSAQNTARVAQWIFGSNGSAIFTGCIGCDEYGSWMSEKLESEGVLPLYIKLRESSTGVCACLVGPDGERSMIARQGAGALLKTRHLQLDTVRKELESADCLLVEGFVIGHSPDVVLFMAENHSSSQIFSMSLSAEYICRGHTDILLQVIPKVNVLFGNEAEVITLGKVISGKNNITVEESIQIIHQLQKSEPRIFVVTCGPKPLIVVNGDGGFLTYDVPGGVKVVDGIGCGDALAGAFLAKYLMNRDLDASAMAGIDAALQILQVPGCDISMTSRGKFINSEKELKQRFIVESENS